MTVNFFLNNAFTYRDRQLRGWGVVWGLGSFYVACGLGAGINVVLADFLFARSIPWWLAGLLGALAGAVWNFAITSSFTWRRRPRGQAA
jgi:dolichol-phosphate mannosyltransferase